MNYLRHTICLFCCIAISTESPLADSPAVQWKPITEDLEATTTSYGTGLFSTSVLSGFRSSLNKFHVQVLLASDFGKTRMDAKSLCAAAHATLCINANFFEPSGKALGLVVNRGIVSSPVHKGGNVLTGIFSVSRTGPSISSRSDFSLEGVVEAIQAGPRLISNGKEVSGLRDTATVRRSGICIDSKSRIIIYVIADSWSHSTTQNVTDLLLSSGMNCVSALNLDGGGSSQLYFSGADKSDEVWFPGRDDVPVVLALVPK